MNPGLAGLMLLAAGAPQWMVTLAWLGIPFVPHGLHASLLLASRSSVLLTQTRGKD